MKTLQIVLTFISLLVVSCNNSTDNKADDKTVVEEVNSYSPKIETRIFRNDTISGSNLNGFGYDILVEGKLYIHQPHIPAISGSTGFITEEDARKTAEYASKKLQSTNSLPALTRQELDSLGIKYN